MKNIVFIVNLKDVKKPNRSNPYQYSIQSWKRWCDKNNCELMVLEDRIYEENFMNANWHKLFIFKLLDIDYDQILIADADTIIHPDAPNVFERTNHQFSVVHNYGSYDWICRSIENYKKHLFPNIDISLEKYFNSGIIICNKKHKQFYDKIINFYLEKRDRIVSIQDTYGVGTDQPILNFFVQQEGVQCKYLPYEWNMQDMNRTEILNDRFTFSKIGWVYHFNGIPNNQNSDISYYWMKKTYEHLYD